MKVLKFHPSGYILYPGQIKAWRRFYQFVFSRDERVLFIEAPKGGGKTWLLLFVHWLATHSGPPIEGELPCQKQRDQSPRDKQNQKDQCDERDPITDLAYELNEHHLPKKKALLIGCESWEEEIVPVHQPYVLAKDRVLTVEEIRSEIANLLIQNWDLKGVPSPQSADEQATFLHALRSRLNGISSPHISLLLVDAPESLDERTRHELETLILAPYADAPGGKILIALRQGARPAWRHWALQEAERVFLPGVKDPDRFWHQKYEGVQPPVNFLDILKARWTVVSAEEDLGLPPLLLDLLHRCEMRDLGGEVDASNEEHLWACLRQEWLLHTFRHYLLEERGEKFIQISRGSDIFRIPITIWEDLLRSLIQSYYENIQSSQGFDAWDWEVDETVQSRIHKEPPSLLLDRWVVYSFLQREGLMLFARGEWWFDPSLRLLFKKYADGA